MVVMAQLPRDPKISTRQLLDLYQTSKDLMRQNLRRRHPEESEAEITERLRAWLVHRPGSLERSTRRSSRTPLATFCEMLFLPSSPSGEGGTPAGMAPSPTKRAKRIPSSARSHPT